MSSKDFYGVTCRDLNNSLYELGINSHSKNGSTWAIVKATPTAATILAQGSTTNPSTKIGGACVGGTTSGPAHLVMYVVDKPVGHVDDPQPLHQGYAGVFAHTSTKDSKGGTATSPLFGILDWQLNSATLK
ncbi:MAG: hypothetical protein M3Y66_06170 [Actinomycetota bacterium]|nr:hypothetical protein [Actinomycetota bacterium]